MPRSDVILLDTHVWLDAVNDRPIAKQAAQRIQWAAEQNLLYVAMISAWEIALLVVRGKLKLGMQTRAWIDHAMRETSAQLAPLTSGIAIESTDLPDNFHADPADRMIVATARELGAVLVTRDQKILDYGERKHVRVLEA